MKGAGRRARDRPLEGRRGPLEQANPPPATCATSSTRSVQELGERVESLITDVRDRVEPVIDEVVAKAEEIAEIGTAKARTLLGHEAKAPAAKSRAA